MTQNREMPGPKVKAATGQVNVRGEDLYLGLCAVCHGTQGQGLPHSSVPLGTNTTAMFPTSINMIREGVPGRNVAHGARMQGVPGFADKLSHENMADLVS